MYVPEPFAVTDSDEVDALLGAARLGVLVTGGATGLAATHLPFVFDRARRQLRGHMARPNPQPATGEGAALVVFPGLSAYISPSFYASKAVHGRSVPTWNYEAVHVHGKVRFVDDTEWLRANVSALSDRFEAGRTEPWSLDDAPGDYIARLLRGIIGVEVAIDRIEAKRKLSQNRDTADRAGVIEGLEASGLAADAAVADAMRRLDAEA